MNILWRTPAVLTLFFAVAASSIAWAKDPQRIPVRNVEDDLTELSLDELMNIEVTSVSKHAEPLFVAAAAIFVITGEEIRRSGLRTIADALRLAPGLQIMRTSAQGYTITSRGLGADKLEVVMDGRSLYSPLNSTVFWDVLDTFLPDIERIEVIRGPGATLWGANAVNGVINIITRSAKDSAGTELIGGGGTEERAFGSLRSGKRVGETGFVRLFVKARELDSSALADGSDALDGMRYQKAGFRYDGAPRDRQSLTVYGDVFDSTQDYDNVDIPSTTGVIEENSGANVGARWSYRTQSAGEMSLSGYYDGYKVAIPGTFAENRDTFDLNFQHRMSIGAINDVTWGLGARQSRDETGGPPIFIVFSPQNRSIQTYNLFVQDQIRLGKNGELTVGSKFEHNDFTGFEIQPGIRLGWALRERLFTWGSVARAVRTPNRVDHDIALCFPGCTPETVFKVGNPKLDSEKLTAYEWGLRWLASRSLSADLAAFFNDYTDLRSFEGAGFDNKLKGQGVGAELSVNWVATDWLELRPFYAFVDLKLEPTSGGSDTAGASDLEGDSARNKAGLRISAVPWADVSADAFLRYVSELKTRAVPAYTELNLRLAWRPWPALELALVGENLLDAQHAEYGAYAGGAQPARTRNEMERSVLAEFHWTWK